MQAIFWNKIKKNIEGKQKRTVGAVEEIEELIGITGIHRMEAYDISNTNGYESVASMDSL